MAKTVQRVGDERPPQEPPKKTDILVALLSREQGADIQELANTAGWLPNSVRGAIAGSLRKKGFVVTSVKEGGRRVYRIAQQAAQ